MWIQMWLLCSYYCMLHPFMPCLESHSPRSKRVYINILLRCQARPKNFLEIFVGCALANNFLLQHSVYCKTGASDRTSQWGAGLPSPCGQPDLLFIFYPRWTHNLFQSGRNRQLISTDKATGQHHCQPIYITCPSNITLYRKDFLVKSFCRWI